MKSKFTYVALFVLIAVILSSCGLNTDELENRFDKYTPDKNVVAVLDNSIFYFSDHTLDLRNIVRDEEPNEGYMFANDKLYFSVSRENKAFDFSFLIYECDINGNQRNVVFEKHGYKTHPWATVNNGVFYIEHYSKNALDIESRIIDSYNISTDSYETVSTGESHALSDYRKNTTDGFSAIKSDEILTILDLQQNEIGKIDHNLLHNSEFGEALKDINCDFYGLDVVNGHIYLIYRIHTNGHPYPHFICEYIVETGQIVFTSFFAANDIESIHVQQMNNE